MSSIGSGDAVKLSLNPAVILLNVSLCVLQHKGSVTACPLNTTFILHTNLYALNSTYILHAKFKKLEEKSLKPV